MRTRIDQPEFLPVSRAEMDALGWPEIDILIVSGDAYIDHPACGPALVGRWLIHHGFRVGLVPQPDWRSAQDVARLGRPRLFAGVTAGALDSMLAHYTAFRRKRRDDAYTPGGLAGRRPNRASLVYANLVRQAFPGLPVVLGGVEASLRRATHYDFWEDGLRRPILFDAKADLLLYGMAERGLLALARALEAGEAPGPVLWASLPGAACVGRRADLPTTATVVELPSHEDIVSDPARLVEATLAMERHFHRADAWALQACGGRELIITPPADPLTTAEMDALYGLPFSRGTHPVHRDPVPALEMMATSLTAHRGCGGGCAFCSLALHQGRRIASRSPESILAEARRLSGRPDFHGHISDVGGPSANMWGARCEKDWRDCTRSSCLHPDICKNFQADQRAYADLLAAIKGVPGVKSVRVGSGLRHDLALRDRQSLEKIVAGFVGGQLKVAPEHFSRHVLKLMRKPDPAVFEEFLAFFREASRRAGKRQYLIPYLLSGLPGCTDEDMADLDRWLHRLGLHPEQVQCFVPTPGVLASAIHHAGRDAQGRSVPVPRTDAQRQRQHAVLAPARRGRPGKGRS